jgi:hypothetical protein
VDTIFFGLACTLSSTILVLGALKDRGEMDTQHGQIILGLMVLQDVAAVVGIAIVPAFDRNPPLPGVVPVSWLRRDAIDWLCNPAFPLKRTFVCVCVCVCVFVCVCVRART